mgnify:CR=1 FL=1
MNIILEYITDRQSNDQFIYLNGQIAGKCYQIVFVQYEEDLKPFVLFDDGLSLQIESDKAGHYFIFEDKTYRFLNGPNLEFKSGLVSSASTDAFRAVVERSLPDKEKLYKDITSILYDYYDFYCEEERRIAAAHIIQSYLIGSLGSTFYLLLEGDVSTGKSTLQRVMALLQYNGCFVGQITIPVLARKIHCLQSTVNIDEFDKVFTQKDERKKALGVLDTGFYAGGTYEITNMNQKKTKDQIQVFQTFSTKTFSGNRVQLSSSLNSRCVTIHTVRGNRSTKNINGMNPEDLKRIEILRDDIFVYTLLRGKSFLNHFQSVQEELSQSEVFGRNADILSIILAVEKEFNQDDKVKQYLMEKQEIDEEDSKDNDRVYIAYSFLLDKCKIGTEVSEINFTNADLVEHINMATGMKDSDEERDYSSKSNQSQYSATPSSVGKLLKVHKVVSKSDERERISSGPDKGRWRYKISKSKILDLIKRCAYRELQDAAKETEDWLTTPIKSDNDSLPF